LVWGPPEVANGRVHHYDIRNYALVAHATATATALGEMFKMCHKSAKFLNYLAIFIYI